MYLYFSYSIYYIIFIFILPYLWLLISSFSLFIFSRICQCYITVFSKNWILIFVILSFLMCFLALSALMLIISFLLTFRISKFPLLTSLVGYLAHWISVFFLFSHNHGNVFLFIYILTVSWKFCYGPISLLLISKIFLVIYLSKELCRSMYLCLNSQV